MYGRILLGWGVNDLFHFPLVLVVCARGSNAAAPLYVGWAALCMMILFVQWYSAMATQSFFVAVSVVLAHDNKYIGLDVGMCVDGTISN